MPPPWTRSAVFYHVYALGALGAPPRNSFADEVSERLTSLSSWLDDLQELGVNAVLLGPVFESTTHGYDVANYFQVDRRLGDAAALVALARDLHSRGMRLVLDTVFHHTGRDFFAFVDVLQNGEQSTFRDWYHLDFSRQSIHGDPFFYEGWGGHYDLAKLNLRNPAVREHLFQALDWWVDTFAVDGLRLDVADELDADFRRALSEHCRTHHSELWLMGEAIGSNYAVLAADGISSATNYEAYKGLWSSHNDKNYFEIAYSLDRQFGAGGIYRDLNLYSFADNHDVDRVASKLDEPAHLYTLYLLLATMPGIPSIYYGSEWGIEGQRTASSDAALRPALDPATMRARGSRPDLRRVIRRFFAIRRERAALQSGAYIGLHVAAQQFAFARGDGRDAVTIAVNASPARDEIKIATSVRDGTMVDVLNEGVSFPIAGGCCSIPLDPHWGRILVHA